MPLLSTESFGKHGFDAPVSLRALPTPVCESNMRACTYILLSAAMQVKPYFVKILYKLVKFRAPNSVRLASQSQ